MARTKQTALKTVGKAPRKHIEKTGDPKPDKTVIPIAHSRQPPEIRKEITEEELALLNAETSSLQPNRKEEFFYELDDYLVSLIISNGTFSQILTSFPRVSKRWRRCSESNSVWTRIYSICISSRIHNKKEGLVTLSPLISNALPDQFMKSLCRRMFPWLWFKSTWRRQNAEPSISMSLSNTDPEKICYFQLRGACRYCQFTRFIPRQYDHLISIVSNSYYRYESAIPGTDSHHPKESGGFYYFLVDSRDPTKIVEIQNTFDRELKNEYDYDDEYECYSSEKSTFIAIDLNKIEGKDQRPQIENSLVGSGKKKIRSFLGGIEFEELQQHLKTSCFHPSKDNLTLRRLSKKLKQLGKELNSDIEDYEDVDMDDDDLDEEGKETGITCKRGERTFFSEKRKFNRSIAHLGKLK